MNLGMHFSIAGGLPKALVLARRLACTALQIFVQNPRSWRWRQVPAQEMAIFRQQRRQYGINIVATHLSYLPNLAAADEPLYQRSWERLQAELALAQDLEVDYLVCHPGHAEDAAAGYQRLAAGLADVLARQPPPPLILLENTAGQKNELGADLRALGAILSRCPLPIGLCLDTAHAFAAGYNLRRADHRRRLRQEIARGPGLTALKLIHCNDSLYPCGSRRDRHWHLGQGCIGRRGLQKFLAQFAGYAAAIILETPKKTAADDPRNLSTARALASGLGEMPAAIPPGPGPDGGRR